MPPVTTAESQEASAAAILKERRFKLSRHVLNTHRTQNTDRHPGPATGVGELFFYLRNSMLAAKNA
jgi:hypothetical protein